MRGRSISDIVSTEVLDLRGRRLPALPESIGRLQNLKHLVFSNNNIATLPLAIGNLAALQDLRIDANELSDLPTTFSWLASLRSFRVHSNTLSLARRMLCMRTSSRSCARLQCAATAPAGSWGSNCCLQVCKSVLCVRRRKSTHMILFEVPWTPSQHHTLCFLMY